MFKTPFNNLNQLKGRIRGAIRSMTQQMIKKVWKNLGNRLDAILEKMEAI